jgi:DNA-directed RNA polymerase alpha subunit
MATEKDSDKLHVLLESLDLSPRTLYALRRAGIKTVDDVLKMLELDNRLPKFSIPNFGKKSHEELIAELHAKGYIEQS